MKVKPTPKRRSLTLLAAKALLCLFTLSLFLSWLAFGHGTGSFGSHLRSQFSRATGFCLSCRLGDVDPTLDYVRTALDKGDISAQLESKAKAFAADNGLQVQLDGANFHYLLFAKNERIELFVTAATEQGLASAQGQLDSLISLKENALAQAPYLTAFSQENEVVEKQKSLHKDGTASDTDKVILARPPHLGELYGVEAALKRSNPSYLAAGDKTGVKFYFLKDSLYQEESHFAYFTTDKDGRAAIYITAGTTDKLRPTELDAPAWALATRFGRDGTFFDTVESLLLHELSHNHQTRMHWNDNPDKRKEMTEASGFVSYADQSTHLTMYLIKVKAQDQSLQYFRLDSRSVEEKNKLWYRTDSQGNWLDSGGHGVDSQDRAMSLTNKQVAYSALVSPSSNYFDTPDEIFAEAMKALRMGGDARQDLFALSPQLYKLVKDEDQKELNATYGYIKVVETRTLVSAGQETALEPIVQLEPNFIRAWDGLVVPMSPSAQAELAQAESRAASKINVAAAVH